MQACIFIPLNIADTACAHGHNTTDSSMLDKHAEHANRSILAQTNLLFYLQNFDSKLSQHVHLDVVIVQQSRYNGIEISTILGTVEQ